MSSVMLLLRHKRVMVESISFSSLYLAKDCGLSVGPLFNSVGSSSSSSFCDFGEFVFVGKGRSSEIELLHEDDEEEYESGTSGLFSRFLYTQSSDCSTSKRKRSRPVFIVT